MLNDDTLGDSIHVYRIGSLIAWCISVGLTTFFVTTALQVSVPVALGVSIVLQSLFTLAQSPLWKWVFKRRNGKLATFAIVMTVIEGAVNAGGIYPIVPRFASTGTGKMLIEAFNLAPNIGTLSALIVALFIGIIAAGLPEYLWGLE
jgi:hypothetical protein